MKGDFTFTSESVTEGHPDKICDQISDAVLDFYLNMDPNARVACECMIKDNNIIVGGEITSSNSLSGSTLVAIVRSTIMDIGYDDKKKGLDWRNCNITSMISRQSRDIAMGVDASEQGAGDQGMIFGYANLDTPQFMPMPIILAHALTIKLSEARKSGVLRYLRPDGKSQVTVRYENHRPISVEHVTIAAQHDDISLEEVREGIIEEVIRKSIPKYLLEGKNLGEISCVNGTGKFVIGGPAGDCGLTGRKIIVDTYGGFARHGGGAFSGKDPSKVDRSAAYMARYIAKNLVAAGLAERCEVQLAYTIGRAEPDNINVETFGTGKLGLNMGTFEDLVRAIFPLKPAAIIKYLGLKSPIYSPTASYGHFGRINYEKNGHEFFSWEKIDRVSEIRNLAFD